MGICNTILSVNAVYKIANGQFNGNSNYCSYFVTYRIKRIVIFIDGLYFNIFWFDGLCIYLTAT